MAPALDVNVIRAEVLPVVVALSTDRIPNIRFNVAKALEVLSIRLDDQPGGHQLVESGILPSLHGLMKDKDADVRFFAEKAIAITTEITSGRYQPAASGAQAVTKEVVMSDA